ncbi:MAG: cob(I)yrinic acid a,c-diamide adenosyltransferase [Bacilli bacterium]
MKIYTHTGDHLTTSIQKKRVFKDDDAIEVVGSIDELQSILMVAHSFTDFEKIRTVLQSVCQDLFEYSQDLIAEGSDFPTSKIKNIEKTIDDFSSKLPKLTEFILPGKTRSSSLIHYARTVARRCERVIVRYAKNKKINDTLLQYINRVSDLLFVLARSVEEKTSL